jgi:opacity protein-like surface antigen
VTAARVIVITVGLAIALPLTQARAQRDAFVDQTEIGYYNGGLAVDDIIEDELAVKRGPTFGLRLIRNFSRRVSADLYWSYSFSELLAVEGTGEDRTEVTYDQLGIVQYGVGLLVYPYVSSNDRLAGFLRVGAGGVSWRPANNFPDVVRPVSTARTSNFAGSLGAGLSFYATEDLELRGEYTFTRAELDRDALLGQVFPFESIGPRTIDAHQIQLRPPCYTVQHSQPRITCGLERDKAHADGYLRIL